MFSTPVSPSTSPRIAPFPQNTAENIANIEGHLGGHIPEDVGSSSQTQTRVARYKERAEDAEREHRNLQLANANGGPVDLNIDARTETASIAGTARGGIEADARSEYQELRRIINAQQQQIEAHQRRIIELDGASSIQGPRLESQDNRVTAPASLASYLRSLESQHPVKRILFHLFTGLVLLDKKAGIPLPDSPDEGVREVFDQIRNSIATLDTYDESLDDHYRIIRNSLADIGTRSNIEDISKKVFKPIEMQFYKDKKGNVAIQSFLEEQIEKLIVNDENYLSAQHEHNKFCITKRTIVFFIIVLSFAPTPLLPTFLKGVCNKHEITKLSERLSKLYERCDDMQQREANRPQEVASPSLIGGSESSSYSAPITPVIPLNIPINSQESFNNREGVFEADLLRELGRLSENQQGNSSSTTYSAVTSEPSSSRGNYSDMRNVFEDFQNNLFREFGGSLTNQGENISSSTSGTTSTGDSSNISSNQERYRESERLRRVRAPRGGEFKLYGGDLFKEGDHPLA